MAVAHAAATLVYLAPDNPLTSRWEKRVNAYMEPWFQQDWRLFSPSPPVGFDRLWGRCRSVDGLWTPWFDPAASLQSTHEAFRISGHGKLLRQARSLGDELVASYVAASEKCRSESETTSARSCATDRGLGRRVLEEPAGVRARAFVSRACEEQFAVSASDLEIKLLRFAVAPWSRRGSGERPKLVAESNLVWEGVR